ncbi:MAG: hypothetical protein ACRC7N_14670, partial [Clostridium sp.]
MNRKTELYKIIIEDKNIDEEGILVELKSDIILKEFLSDYYKNIVYNEVINDELENDENVNSEIAVEEYLENNYIKKFDLKSKSMCYYVKSVNIVEKEEDESYTTRNVTLEYIKYDKVLKVVDKNTLEEKFKKSKNQGDLEKQHYIIRVFDERNIGLIVWERVLGAVSLGLIEKNINSAFRQWVKRTYKDDSNKKLHLLRFNVKIYPIPSKNIFAELANLDKISVMKVTVDKENFTNDEDILFSEDNISRDEVDIVYKPIQGYSFSKSKVQAYVRKFLNKEKVKRILINGKKSGNLITLNTELMKMSEFIDVKIGA